MPGRLPGVQLSVKTIITAAIEILDTYGLADMTMRRVATQLGVAPGALYWHVANKQELISAIATTILAPALDSGVPAAAPGADPAAPAAKACQNLRAALLSHRDGAELVGAAISQPVSSIRSRIEAQLARSLGPLQLEAAETNLGARTLLHQILGATSLEQAGRQHDLAQDSDRAGAGTERRGEPGAEFTAGVALILSGLRAHASNT